MASETSMRLKRVALGAVITALIAFVAFVAGGVSQGTISAKSAPQHLAGAQSQITQEQAEQTALDANPGTTVRESELENENGSVVYEVELSDGNEVQVDAKSGAIIGNDDNGEVENRQDGQADLDGQNEQDENENGQDGEDQDEGQNGQGDEENGQHQDVDD